MDEIVYPHFSKVPKNRLKIYEVVVSGCYELEDETLNRKIYVFPYFHGYTPSDIFDREMKNRMYCKYNAEYIYTKPPEKKVKLPNQLIGPHEEPLVPLHLLYENGAKNKQRMTEDILRDLIRNPNSNKTHLQNTVTRKKK